VKYERATFPVVVARLDRAIQYSEASVIEPRSCGVLDTPHARGMTTVRAEEQSDEAIHTFFSV